ncbi:unnamed protein product, partial [Mesorhabditis belari]|uniref:Uncharacterized protein n=1 Tax=Mesorhabditis belari TaxID=2138241 RepID=A0AAF3EMK6_9BILA
MGDREGAARADRMLQENEAKAERLDRERQGAIVGVTYLNKRNRNHMKETFLGDTPVTDMKKDDDPFTRKSGRMKVVSGKATLGNIDAIAAPSKPQSEVPSTLTSAANGKSAPVKLATAPTLSLVAPTTSMRQSDLFKMHAVDIDYGDLDIALGSRPNPPPMSTDSPAASEPKSRGKLSLEEYKRRRQMKTDGV